MSTPETCRAAYRNVINWIQSHLVGQLLNSIHDAQTQVYKSFTVNLSGIYFGNTFQLLIFCQVHLVSNHAGSSNIHIQQTNASHSCNNSIYSVRDSDSGIIYFMISPGIT